VRVSADRLAARLNRAQLHALQVPAPFALANFRRQSSTLISCGGKKIGAPDRIRTCDLCLRWVEVAF
ncbi:MAG: hypothetical protein V3T13_07955, partial [Hyphomicrobium sp.]